MPDLRQNAHRPTLRALDGRIEYTDGRSFHARPWDTEAKAIGTAPGLSAVKLKTHLTRCGYRGALLQKDYRFGDETVALAAFAHHPTDARSACIAVVDSEGDPKPAVAGCRALGAPVVFVCHQGRVEWWKQTTTDPVLQRSPLVKAAQLNAFFREYQTELAPNGFIEPRRSDVYPLTINSVSWMSGSCLSSRGRWANSSANWSSGSSSK